MKHDERLSRPRMTVRTKLYWSIYVQWLAERDLLSYYLDSVIDHGESEMNIIMRRRLALNHDAEDTPEIRDMEFLRIVNNFIEHKATCNNVAKRFTAYTYSPRLPDEHPFKGRSWLSISAAFVQSCIYGKITSTIRLRKVVKIRGLG